jgi:hypothetical protein
MEKDWKLPATGTLAESGGDGETGTAIVAVEAREQPAQDSSIGNSEIIANFTKLYKTIVDVSWRHGFI